MTRGATAHFEGALAEAHVTGKPDVVGSVDEIRSQLLRKMREARQTFLDHATERFSQSEPYHQLEPSVAADVLAAVGKHYDTFLDCLTEDRDLTPKERARLDREGSKRAKQGISLEAVESMFRTVLRDAMSMLHALATDAEDDNGSGLAMVAELDTALTVLALTAVAALAEGHRRVQGDVAQMIGDFVAHATASQRVQASQARLTYALAVLVPPHPTDVAVSVSAARAWAAGHVVSAASSPVYIPQLHTAVISPFTGDAELEDLSSRVAREHGVRVVISRFRSVGEAIRKYETVKAHLHLLLEPQGAPQILHERDIAYLAMLHSLDGGLATMIIDAVLGAALDLSETELSDVIERLDCALSVWGNKAEMARALGRHRHTVYNFLDRVEELTGLRADDGRGAFLLRLAVDIVKLRDQ